jgi:acyl carrier protein
MDKIQIEKKVIRTLKHVLTKKEQDITLEKKLIEDLGLDSFGSLELIFELEDALSLRIPDEQAKKFTTVNDVLDYILENVPLNLKDKEEITC